MLHYIPQYVSSSLLLIIRRTNCITKASGIVILCKQPYSTRVKSGVQSVTYILLKIGILKSLCYDARSEKHQSKKCNLLVNIT